MDAKDLRIGNKVQDNNGFIFTVVSIHDDGTVYCDFDGNEGDVWEFDKNNPCQGIELTEEILLKCGFARDGYTDYYTCRKVGFTLNLRGVIGYRTCIWMNRHIKHLHQLQNLYFALCNEELNVQL